ERSISLLLSLDLKFLGLSPKTLTNSLQAISRDFDTLSYLTLTKKILNMPVRIMEWGSLKSLWQIRIIWAG
ncbi:hypothetical protein NSB04_07040, partial [Blautia pseudococcoides]|nr:hypothetical protein [Blautia pseudococcoides]